MRIKEIERAIGMESLDERIEIASGLVLRPGGVRLFDAVLKAGGKCGKVVVCFDEALAG